MTGGRNQRCHVCLIAGLHRTICKCEVFSLQFHVAMIHTHKHTHTRVLLFSSFSIATSYYQEHTVWSLMNILEERWKVTDRGNRTTRSEACISEKLSILIPIWNVLVSNPGFSAGLCVLCMNGHYRQWQEHKQMDCVWLQTLPCWRQIRTLIHF